MSSDYLNYELSKELHDLGVVFDTEYHYYKLTGTASPVFSNEGNIHQWGKKYKWCCYAPSTAQLIDEISKIYPFTLFTFWKSDRKIEVDSYKVTSIYGGEVYGHDPCATTALGKALIALIKEDRECKQ